MREMAFADVAVRRRLEETLHPLISSAAQQQADQSDAAVVVFDVPLLAESLHWRSRCDRILVVDCSEATQIARVTQRSGWPAEQVRRVIAQQAPRELRRAIADAVIHNDGCAMPELAASVSALWRIWSLPA
jgi:dephospho-CoA kinase